MKNKNGPPEKRTLEQWRDLYDRVNNSSFHWDQVALKPEHFLGLLEDYFELRGIPIRDIGLCRWCDSGNPAVPSSVSDKMVHPDTPVGRVVCGKTPMPINKR